MAQFDRYIGIDYSGAQTPTSSLKGLRVYMGDHARAPVEMLPPPSPRKYWTRRGVAEWLVERLREARPTLIGIDHGFSFPLRYFEAHRLPLDWPGFLDDFQAHWPTDADHTYVDFVRDGIRGSGAERTGDPRWRRLTELRAGAAKSVFHFDVQGSVAKSTHAGLPWLRYLRQQMGSAVHFWPFDGWVIPAGRSAVVEVYPSLWRASFPPDGRTDDQHDAYSAAEWMRCADLGGSLAKSFDPPLDSTERATASIEGWILGVMEGKPSSHRRPAETIRGGRGGSGSEASMNQQESDAFPQGFVLQGGAIAVQVRGITERDIDLLLLEQLVLDSLFRDGFLAEVGLASCGRLTGAARSVNTTTGESDLELTLVEGQRVTKVLVENKVDALLQPRQAERYAERAAAYRAAGDCDQVVTVLVAPESYAGAAAGFDRTVTYESVRRLLGGEEADDRARYKHFLLREAIERCASGWVLVPDEAATAFWLRYWELSKTVAPQLNMRRPEEKPATSGFIFFRPTALVRGVALIHKVPYGDVDLQFAGRATSAAAFEGKHGGHLRPGMHIERASKSLVVRMQVPRIVIKAPFEQSEAAVRQALDAAAQLLKWYTRWVRPRPSGRAGRRR